MERRLDDKSSQQLTMLTGIDCDCIHTVFERHLDLGEKDCNDGSFAGPLTLLLTLG